MAQPNACIRCQGTELASATLEGGEALRLAVDGEHVSPMSARVCLACGAVMLTATRPGALRVGDPPEHEVQEYDF